MTSTTQEQAGPAPGAQSGEPIIQIKDLCKPYAGADFKAVAGLSLDVYTGEIFGLLGPNGAGKATLVKIVMSLVRPTRAGS